MTVHNPVKCTTDQAHQLTHSSKLMAFLFLLSFPSFKGMIVGISSFSSQIFSKNAGTRNNLVLVEKFVSEHDSGPFFNQVILFSLL